VGWLLVVVGAGGDTRRKVWLGSNPRLSSTISSLNRKEVVREFR